MTGQEFKELRESLNMSQSELAVALDVTRVTISRWENSEKIPTAQEKAVKLMYNNDTIIDTSIPVRESKEVYKTKSGNIIDELPNGKYLLTVPLLGHKAHATYISEYTDADYIDDLTKVSFIVDRVPRGKYMAFEIINDSMNDATLTTPASRSAILSGDIVLGRELGKQHWKSKLNTNGYPFWIIVHKDTILCKEIVNHDLQNGTITCHSLNTSPEYKKDFDLNLDDCLQLFNIIKKQI